jgi:hypothetical protein
MKSIKSLYMTDYQLRELALFVSGETVARWETSPRDLLELEMRLNLLAEVAPHAGSISISGEYHADDNGDDIDSYTVSFESPRALLLAAARVCNDQANARLRSAMALFKDLIDPIPSPHRTIVFKAEERD